MDKPFVAWDGEGITVHGRHIYVMLCNSLGESVVCPSGINTLDALQFIGTSKAIHSPSIHVVFGGGYDTNMLLRDMDIESVRTLWTTGEVTWQQYRIKYRHRKQLTLSKYASTRWKQNAKGQYVPNYEWTLKLWDTQGFFQCSFVNACEQYHVTIEPLIAEMKRQRGTSTWNLSDPTMQQVMVDYCINECGTLTTLMDQLRTHLRTAEIELSRWDGAGAVAGALMKREKVKQYSDVPGNLEPLAANAYSGGRIEAFQYGNHVGPTYVYDINSAYPSVIRDLPDLVHGRWIHLDGILDHGWENAFGLVRVRFTINTRSKINPFFWRGKNGNIYYPHQGEGWYHICELAETCTWNTLDEIEVLESWIWFPETNHKPFEFVNDLYRQRRRWKEDGNGAQMAAKLGLNSLYGKLVQQLGGTKEKRPPYHNLLWGGYVTAKIRSILYGAMSTNPDAVVYSATDGICSTSELPLRLNNELGGWECTEYGGVTVIQPGVYFLTNERGESVVTHYRGFDPGTLTRERIVEAWRNGESTIAADSTRFVGMGSALASRDYENKWCSWPIVKRQLTLYPKGKRYINTRHDYGEFSPAYRLVRTTATTPIEAMAGQPSHPYKIRWAEDEGIDGVPSPIVADECEFGRL